MNTHSILSLRELADYIRLHENDAGTMDVNDDCLKFKDTGQWKLELASVDHILQQKLIASRDEDLDLLIKSSDKGMPLSGMTDETLIDLDFHAETRNKALSNLAKMASAARIASSYEEMFLELESREKLCSTAIGNGIALPHARFPYRMIYREPKLIIARSALGVDFGAPDKKRVYLFFMPCAPTQFIHLRMMAQIVKLLHIPNVIERFKNTAKKRDIPLIIRAFEQLQILPGSERKP